MLTQFDEFFKVRRNIIFERAKFNRRYQKPGESAEQYITALYSLVETCDYGTLKDDLLRDRLVVGIADQGLSERLQLVADLTLEKAKTQIRQKEAVQDQHKQLQRDGSKGSPIEIDGIGRRRWQAQRPQTPQGGAHRHPQNIFSCRLTQELDGKYAPEIWKLIAWCSSRIRDNRTRIL